ncbi:hypothetical protein DYB32_004070 [Aphanomyces invadans]|uniref:PWWP domain-containing protein n=1 Tax=Aphanomyces invadans TaxID=157072 RepID=A0A3R6VYJ9_9STRA|nr:hypothetical protein DYB32_004070 [Aphanomyces invadans]
MSAAAKDGVSSAATDGSASTGIDDVTTNDEASSFIPTEGSDISQKNGHHDSNGDDITSVPQGDDEYESAKSASPNPPHNAVDEKLSANGDQGGAEASDTESVPAKTKQPRKSTPAKKVAVVAEWDDVAASLSAQFLAKSSELVSQDKAMYGQVAWARIRGYPYWPGYICDPKMLVHDYVSMQKYLPLMDTHFWVYFYQTNNSAPVLRADIALWEDSSKPFHDGFPTKKGKPYKNAKFDEAKTIAADKPDIFQETTGEKMARKRKEGAAAKRPLVDQPTESEPAPVKKRRGRPPKNPSLSVAPTTSVVTQHPDVVEGPSEVTKTPDSAATAPAPKKRGRPPKVKPQPVEVVPGNEPPGEQQVPPAAKATPTTPIKAKGRPGRKPKAKPVHETEEPPSTTKNVTADDMEKTTVADEIPDQDTKEIKPPVPSQEPKRQRGRPPKDTAPKRRGRPPKERPAVPLQIVADAPAEVANVDEPGETTKTTTAVEALGTSERATVSEGGPMDANSNEESGKKTPRTTSTTVAEAKKESTSHDVDGDAESKTESDMNVKPPQRKRPAANAKGLKTKKVKTIQDEEVETEENNASSKDTATTSDVAETALVIETLDLELATNLAKELQGCVKGESKESISLALKIMNALIESTQFTLDTLQKSGLPVVVNLLRNTSINPNVKKTASALRKHMIRQSKPATVDAPIASVENEAPEPTSEVSVPIEPSAIADIEPKLSVGDHESENHTTPEGDDGVSGAPFSREREIVVQMIQEVITSPKKGLYDRFLDTTEEYKSQARRVIFGLRDHDLCRQKVLSGSLHVLELVFATDEAFTQYNLAPWKAK